VVRVLAQPERVILAAAGGAGVLATETGRCRWLWHRFWWHEWCWRRWWWFWGRYRQPSRGIYWRVMPGPLGGGGGGTGAARGTFTSNTVGVGGDGLIVITYTAVATTFFGFGWWSTQLPFLAGKLPMVNLFQYQTAHRTCLS